MSYPDSDLSGGTSGRRSTGWGPERTNGSKERGTEPPKVESKGRSTRSTGTETQRTTPPARERGVEPGAQNTRGYSHDVTQKVGSRRRIKDGVGQTLKKR
jgi:hypothetical protein